MGAQQIIGSGRADQDDLDIDFNLLAPGALHRANGGYLILDAGKLLGGNFGWASLKRALNAGEIRIETLEQLLSQATTVSLEPEPIPLAFCLRPRRFIVAQFSIRFDTAGAAAGAPTRASCFLCPLPNPDRSPAHGTTVLHCAACRLRFYFKRHRPNNLGLSVSRIGAASEYLVLSPVDNKLKLRISTAAAVAPAAGLEAPGAGPRDRVRRDRHRALPRALWPQFGAITPQAAE